MSVLRQLNVLGQQRLDVPHIRSIESSIAADFDVVAGRVQAGGKALVVRGFTLSNYTTGTNANAVQLSTADAILYNMNSSESGTFLWVPADRAVEVLNSATNSRVQGGFTAGQTNYIGLDLVRSADDSTSDLVQFLDPNTLLEQPKSVPLARTLDYKIVISTTPFSASPNIVPVAKIITDAQNQISSASNAVQDARNGMFRLGSGGDFPNAYNSFTWPQARLEYDPNISALSGLDHFSGGDKGITSMKDWMDSVATRLWEVGGGQNWYSPTSDRNIKLVKDPNTTFTSTADNFEWVSGLYASNHLHWKGLKILFQNANIPGVYYNIVTDQISDDPAGNAALSKTALNNGECIYVDLDRTTNATVVAKKAAIQTLGSPTIPGSRVILAWRDIGNYVFARDSQYAVNTSFAAATTVAIGAVRLAYNAAIAGTPTVTPLDTNNSVSIGTGSYTIVGNNTALTLVGGGSGAGLTTTGGSTSGNGLTAIGGGPNGPGALITGVGSGTGLNVTQGATGQGVSVSTANGIGIGITAGGNNAAISASTSGTAATAQFTSTGASHNAHAILAQGSSGTGGSWGIKSTGGDNATPTAANDATLDPGGNAGGVFIAGRNNGSAAIAGYGGGINIAHFPLNQGPSGVATPDGEGGYFLGVSGSDGSAGAGIKAKGGTGTLPSHGVVGHGGAVTSGSSAGGRGLIGWGGAGGGAGSGGTGVEGTGGAGTLSDGRGGLFTGGGTSGIGVDGLGVGSGVGVRGRSGNAGGAGVQGIGNGSSDGGNFGTAGAGTGVIAASTSGFAILANGNASASAVRVLPGAGQVGVDSLAASNVAPAILGTGAGGGLGIKAASSATNVDVLKADGYADFTGGTQPTTTTGFSNRLTKKNIAKAWFNGTTNSSAGFASSDGFNISSTTINSNSVDFVFATAMANALYCVVATASFNSGSTRVVFVAPVNKSTSGFTLTLQGYISAGVVSNFAALNTTAAYEIHVAVFAAQ